MSIKLICESWGSGLIKKALRKFEGQPLKNKINAEKAEYCSCFGSPNIFVIYID